MLVFGDELLEMGPTRCDGHAAPIHRLVAKSVAGFISEVNGA